MLDIKFIRENKKLIEGAALSKSLKVNLEKLLKIDSKRRQYIQEIDKLRQVHKKISKDQSIYKHLNKGRAKEITKSSLSRQRSIKEKREIKALEKKLAIVNEKFTDLMYTLPNLPRKDVKIGKDETENEVIREIGDKTNFSFKPKDYLEITEKLDLIDVKRAAKVAGSRFGYIKGNLVLLQFAIIQYALENLSNAGFKPILPPGMINEESAQGLGYLEAGGEQDKYHFIKDKMYFIGTAEHSIVPIHKDEILLYKDLPKRYLGYSTNYRREAGAYGKDTKGILRVHQFDKVEMISFCEPGNSDREHEFMLSQSEKLVQGLKIPYRVVKMCTGDLAFPSARTYDIECWMPGQDQYRETHSISTCTDFQARRLNIKFRDKTNKSEYVHTLNGTAFALGRILIAICENYQTEKGTIVVPEILQKYTHLKEIK
jgi:seryl-tRNA synthetase